MSTASRAAELDAADPLAGFRDRFAFPDPDLVYLDGNSLGRLSRSVQTRSRQVVDHEWGDRLIRSWNESWWEAPQRVGDLIARIVGAAPGEVVIADSTSVNLYKLAVAALRARPDRPRILTDDLNFPSDVHILHGAAATAGSAHHVEVIRSPDGIHGPAERLLDRLDDEVALVSLSHVTFKSGYRYDMAAVTNAVHEVGALVVWDLSHSAGAVAVDLKATDADLAVGCTYKYLNGGPGAPAYLFIRSDLQPLLANPIPGWWGHVAPFDFELGFTPAGGIRRFLTGTAPMLSLAAIEPAAELVLEAGVERLAAKARRQTDYLISRADAALVPHGFDVRTPRRPDRRGAHVSLGHPEALGIDLALINEFGVLPDFRPPDNLRLGIAPLYTSYADLDAAVAALETIVRHGRHRAYADHRPTVT